MGALTTEQVRERLRLPGKDWLDVGGIGAMRWNGTLISDLIALKPD